MSEKLTKEMTVGSIVAADFNRAEVLENMGIDYCCHGSDTLEEASKKANLNPDDVIARLDRDAAHGGSAPDALPCAARAYDKCASQVRMKGTAL